MWALQALSYAVALAFVWGWHFGLQWLGVPWWFSEITWVASWVATVGAVVVLSITSGGR